MIGEAKNLERLPMEIPFTQNIKTIYLFEPQDKPFPGAREL